MKTANYYGTWSKPGSATELGTGVLSLPEDGYPTLTVFRSHINEEVIPLIVGKAFTGQEITLCESYLRQLRGFSPEAGDTTYAPSRVLLGHRFTREDEIQFRALSCEFHLLREWFGASSLKWSPPHTIQYARPEPLRTQLAIGKLGIHRGLSEHWRNFEIRLEEGAFVEIESTKPLPVEAWYRSFLYPFANFITLATGRPSGEKHLSFYMREASEETPPDRGIHVLDRAMLPRRPAPTPIHPHDMYFSFSDVATDWEAVIQEWFHMISQFERAIDLFFSVEYKPTMYLEQMFAGVVQALEAFHRSTRTNRELSEADHKVRLAEVISSAPAKHQEWLEQRLASSNEPSLRRRLEDLLGECDEVVGPFLRDKSAFIKKVVDTRNFLAHGTSRGRGVTEGWGDLWEFVYVLSMMMRTLLFRRLIPDKNKANQFMTARSEYHFQLKRICLPR